MSEDLLDGIGTLDDLDASGRRVLVRADLNVPLTDDGQVADDLRIEAALPTLQHLIGAGAQVTLCSHLGRPQGEPDPALSLHPVAERLAELLDQEVYFSGHLVDDQARRTTAAMAPGEISLLENLRFDPGEKANDPGFVTDLAWFGDAYVNDAFGAAHRAHASVVGVAEKLPAFAGRLLVRELSTLGRLLSDPPRPYVAVLGGAKVSDKLGVIDALLDVVDRLVIGGGMAFTFLAAQGHRVGDSILQEDQIETCAARLAEHGERIVLPHDTTVLLPDGRVAQLGVDLPDGAKGLDIGPGTAAAFSDVIAEARTVLWNGPMGMFEDDRFVAGTRTVAEAVADCRGFTVVGGGDVVAAVGQLGFAGDIDHISTGGGASLELLELGDLPGLEALRKAPNAG